MHFLFTNFQSRNLGNESFSIRSLMTNFTLCNSSLILWFSFSILLALWSVLVFNHFSFSSSGSATCYSNLWNSRFFWNIWISLGYIGVLIIHWLTKHHLLMKNLLLLLIIPVLEIDVRIVESKHRTCSCLSWLTKHWTCVSLLLLEIKAI